jgi:ABC-type glycerol-3-phosphate transport system permease component
MRTKRRLPSAGGAVRGLTLALMFGASLYPIAFVVMSSLKSKSAFATNYFLPDFGHAHLDNYRAAAEEVLPSVWNSVLVSAATVALVLACGVPAAYAFAWRRFRGQQLIYTVAICTMMVPAVLTFVPMFVLVRDLGLIDTRWSMVLPYTAGTVGLSVFLLRSFFRAVPQELVEAAKLDGSGDLRVLWHVVLPLSLPTLATLVTLNVLWTWNQFLWPLVTISSEEERPVPVALAFLTGDRYNVDYPQLMAGYVLSALPLVIVLAVTMRAFIRGMLSGALKA